MGLKVCYIFYMEITSIKKQYEKDGKVQMMFSTYGGTREQSYGAHWLNINKDGNMLPEEDSPNSFTLKDQRGNTDYYVTLNEFDQLQYRLLTTRDGYMSNFVAFTKVKDDIFMVTMSKDDFETKKSEINCNSAEKDRILNGLKQPNTVIVNEDRPHIYYANFPGMKQVKDNFNLATEDEILQKEVNTATYIRDLFFRGLDGKPPVAKKFNAKDLGHIRLYGRMFSSDIDDYAIRFLSDSQVLCTGFNVIMESKGNYKIALEETAIDLEKVYGQLHLRNAFKWNEENCLDDPDRETLRAVEKKRLALKAAAEPARKTTFVGGHLMTKLRNLLGDREKE